LTCLRGLHHLLTVKVEASPGQVAVAGLRAAWQNRNMSEVTRTKRSGGRAGRQTLRTSHEPDRDAFITRLIKPYELVSDEGLEIIEHNADTILEEVGIEVRDYPSAIKRFKDAGADVDGTRVRFPRGMCRQVVSATAPRVYTQHARNPINNVQIGGDATVFAPNYGSPFAFDLDNGRRYATITDFQNFVKLAYMSPRMHHSGGTVCEPVDIPVSKRHLDMVYAHIKYSDKGFMGSVTAGERAQDSVEMARIGFGGDLQDRTVMTSLINASSPLVWDASMLASAEVYATNNQATIITPFILAGAMAPSTSAGVATQTLAEALAGMMFTQLVRPGAPVILGSFASSMSMQTGAPTFGTPEPAIVLYTMAALARRLGVPFRSGGSLTASKLPDAQAAYESASTLLPTLMAGTNFVLHAAGWLEGGLAIGYEKFILDDDQLGMMATFAKGLDISPNGQALDAIRENPPGNHFLGTAHTLANFESAFYRSITSDNSSYEQWLEDGGDDSAKRANRMWKERLANYVAPPLDDAIDEELKEYVTKRKNELPDTFG
jgi:trimethylamine--corrinoid protein Co-methyltransferase